MNDTMKKFRRRIVRNAVINSLISAGIIACGVLIVSALASWIFGFKAGLWMSLGLFVGAFVSAGLLFYFFKFRPSAKDVARKIDALGLEERLITMLELEGDESYIAQVQREDAKAALATADHTLLKVAATTTMLVLIGAFALFGVGALTVDSLHYAGIIPSGVQALEKQIPKEIYKLSYSVSRGEGAIYYWTEEGVGEEFSETVEVIEGEDGPAVIAVPADGYVFAGWSDGSEDPYRMEKNVKRSLTVRATFEVTEDVPDLEDEQIGEDGNGDGDGDSSAPPSPDGENGTPRPGGNGSGMQNHDQTHQQYKDGNTFYGDDYRDAYQDMLDRFGESSGLPEELQGGCTGYMDSIGTGSSQEGEGDAGGGTGGGENP